MLHFSQANGLQNTFFITAFERRFVLWINSSLFPRDDGRLRIIEEYPFSELTAQEVFRSYETSFLEELSEKGNMFRASLNYYYGDVSTSVLSRMDSVLVDKTSPHEHYQEIVPQKSNVWSGDALYNIMLGDKGSLNLDLRGYFWGIRRKERRNIRIIPLPKSGVWALRLRTALRCCRPSAPSAWGSS